MEHWIDYEASSIYRLSEAGAYNYGTPYVALDADDYLRAYNPDATGLDANAYAGFPSKGGRSVLVIDPVESSQPYVQQEGPCAGFFVSKTSSRSHVLLDTAPSVYVDAETFPYNVFPGAFYAVHGSGRYGDLLIARDLDTGQSSAAIVADGGPFKAPLGEMSLALAVALGGHDPDARTGRGAPKGPFQYVIFPGSASEPAWPRDLGIISMRAQYLLN